MNIALAADHTGFSELAELKSYIKSLGHICHDFGPESLTPEDDYPDYIRPAALAVASGECDMGIVLGGSGQGEAIVANRIAGVRCAVFYGPAVAKRPVDAENHDSHDPYEIIRLSRIHNNANMLSLATRFLSLEEIKQAIKLWLDTAFGNQERHVRRITKIDGAK